MTEHRITPAAICAFVAGDEVQLHRLLGLRPWEPSPLLLELEGQCPDDYGNLWAEAWPKLREIRRALQRAARQ